MACSTTATSDDDDDNAGGAGAMGSKGDCKPADVRAAELEDCDEHETVAAFEKVFLQQRCGNSGDTCHNTTFPPLFKPTDDIFPKLVNKGAALSRTTSC